LQLFRNLSDDGFDYFDVYVGRNAEGKVVGYDLYSYQNGQRDREDLRGFFD
jgi:hypothetical protein